MRPAHDESNVLYIFRVFLQKSKLPRGSSQKDACGEKSRLLVVLSELAVAAGAFREQDGLEFLNQSFLFLYA